MKRRAQRERKVGTQILTRLTHLILPSAIAFAAITLSTPARAADAPSPREARVIAVSGDRAYIDAPDLARAPAGTRLLFLSRRDAIARGELLRAVDSFLVVARLDSGSLAREKKLEKIRVVAQPPALPAMRVLRVGYPASGRAAPLFTCPPSPARAPAWTRVEPEAPRSWRLIRDPAAAAPAGWPDTVVVRLFDEAADEEIALERAEIDAAVFWPGELSAHLRAQAGGDAPLAALPGAIGAANLAAGDTTLLARFDREPFRDDLLPLPWTAVASAETARLELDPAWPGRTALQRLLAAEPRTGTRAVRLRFGGGPRDTAAAVAVFEAGCRVVCAPALRPSVVLLAPALVGALACPPERAP